MSKIRVPAVAIALLAGIVALAPPAQAEPDIAWFDEIAGASINVDGTYIPIVGHFTDLLLDDIIWYAPGTATDHRWTPCPGCPMGRFTKSVLQPQVNGSYQPVVGDFAGDGKDDVFWSGPGADHLWTNNGSGGFTSRRIDVGGGYGDAVLLPNSRTGSGKDDILWRRYTENDGRYRVTGALWVFPDNGSGAVRTRSRPTLPPGEPIVGDFDGSGASDILWYSSGNGCSYVCAPPSQLADQLWRRSTNESATFSRTTLNIRGPYAPLSGLLSGDDDLRSDILWLGSYYGYRGSDQDRPDSFWEGRSSGSFAAVTTDIPRTARGFVLEGPGPDVVGLWGPSGIDLWFDTPSGPVVRESGNEDRLDGDAIVGSFLDAGQDDIFFYTSGQLPERIYHRID